MARLSSAPSSPGGRTMSTRGALRASAGEVSRSAPARLWRTVTARDVGRHRGRPRWWPSRARRAGPSGRTSRPSVVDPRVAELGHQLAAQRVDEGLLVGVDQASLDVEGAGDRGAGGADLAGERLDQCGRRRRASPARRPRGRAARRRRASRRSRRRTRCRTRAGRSAGVGLRRRASCRRVVGVVRRRRRPAARRRARCRRRARGRPRRARRRGGGSEIMLRTGLLRGRSRRASIRSTPGRPG